MDTTRKTVTRVRIEHSDGTYIELVDPEACRRWKQMVDFQLAMAYTRGMAFEIYPWVEGTLDTSTK